MSERDSLLVQPFSTRQQALCDIDAERDRQNAKWGGVPGKDRRDDHTYAAVLGEEFGECCKAWLERDVAALRMELVQTAAVAVAWIEELDNGGGLARPAQEPTADTKCECGHAARNHVMMSQTQRCEATVYTTAPLGGGSAYPCPCRQFEEPTS